MVSTKGRYALRVMIDIAENGGKNVPLKDIANRQEISKKYLEIIVRDLVKNELIKGSSGKGGGYSLCKEADEYTVGEIIEAAEGPIVTVACLAENSPKCPRSDLCKTLPFWRELENTVHGFLFSKKLKDLI